jgi:hypothetical protein
VEEISRPFGGEKKWLEPSPFLKMEEAHSSENSAFVKKFSFKFILVKA